MLESSLQVPLLKEIKGWREMAGLEAPATPYRLSDFEQATESTSTAWFPAAGIDSIWLLWAWPSFTANVKFWSLSILMQTLSRLRFLCLASNLQFSLVDTDPEISAVKLHLPNCHLPASKPRWIYLVVSLFPRSLFREVLLYLRQGSAEREFSC